MSPSDEEERARIRRLDAARVRHRVEEYAKPIDVFLELPRQLVEDRSALSTELIGSTEELVERIVRILQLLHVGQIPAGLHRKQESTRRPRAPRLE